MRYQLTRREWLYRSAVAAAVWSTGGVHQLVAAEDTVADTAQGRVRGIRVDGVHMFRGVPYGGATEGAGRFMPPTAPQAWTGVRDAMKAGPRAVQGPANIFMNPFIGEYFSGGRPDRQSLSEEAESENCLNLNVLTPGLTGRRAVMVYIHGGGFTQGSGVLTALSDRFVRENDVVLVGINHRLNMFGYLYLGGLSEKYADSGNVGQLDLVTALRWVKENISRFGGDPSNVMIFGESGGGGKVSALLAMPSATGLFHRAIIESGSQLRVNERETASRSAQDALEKIGVTAQTLDQLPTLPLEKLRTAGGGTGPVVDGRSVPTQTWDPAAPAISANVAMIIGNCKDEQTLFSMQNAALYSLDADGLRKQIVDGGMPLDATDKLIALYRRDYPSDSPTDIYFRIITDRGTRENAMTQAERKVAQGKASVYMYYFGWNTPLVQDGKAIKAFHTAELPLAMRLVKYPESEPVSKQIAGAWAAFAKSGNPNHSGLPNWPTFDIQKRATMVFDIPSRVVNDPNREERALLKANPPSGGRGGRGAT
jgi:para-nitrobenzyl esterase